MRKPSRRFVALLRVFGAAMGAEKLGTVTYCERLEGGATWRPFAVGTARELAQYVASKRLVEKGLPFSLVVGEGKAKRVVFLYGSELAHSGKPFPKSLARLL